MVYVLLFFNLYCQACQNLLSLNLKACTSITKLPHSISRLTLPQTLLLEWCKTLQKIPTYIRQLTSLQILSIHGCRSLEALLDTITTLSSLSLFWISGCSCISKLPATFGHMTYLTFLNTDLSSEWQVNDIGKFNALHWL